jgi:hypothetical protein
VAFGLVTMTSSGVLMAGAPSTLSGRVLTQNGTDPRPGVVVALVEPATERAYRSSPTDARGAFSIDAAPAGDYALLVEAPEGAFLASSRMQLAPASSSISLARSRGNRASRRPWPASARAAGELRRAWAADRPG